MTITKVCGWVINREGLIAWGIEQGLGAREDPQEDLINACVDSLACAVGLFYHVRLEAVLINRKVELCISLASNDPFKGYQLPGDKEQIEELRELLGSRYGPRWFRRV